MEHHVEKRAPPASIQRLIRDRGAIGNLDDPCLHEVFLTTREGAALGRRDADRGLDEERPLGAQLDLWKAAACDHEDALHAILGGVAWKAQPPKRTPDELGVVPHHVAQAYVRILLRHPSSVQG